LSALLAFDKTFYSPNKEILVPTIMTEHDNDIETTKMLTNSEHSYDIGNKGYLTKVERQLKRIDDELLGSGHPIPDPIKQQRRHSTTTSMIGSTTSNNNTNKKKKSFGSSTSTHTSSPYYSNDDDDSDEVDDDDQDPSYDEFDDEDMDRSMHGKVDLGDDQKPRKNTNYHEYLNKVQRDFEDYERQHHGKNESSSETSSRQGIFRTRDMVVKRTTATTRGYYRPRCIGTFSFGAITFLVAVTILLVANFFMTLRVWTELAVVLNHHNAEFTVDTLTGALVSSSSKDGLSGGVVAVSTIAAGFTLELPVIMPADASKLIGVQQEHPFACVGLDTAVDLWTHVKRGVTTSVVLVNKDTADDSLRRNEHGVRLTFHGATQNSTHACIPTENQNHTLCIDFVSRRCDAFDDDNDNDNQVTTNGRATNKVAEAHEVGDGSATDDDDNDDDDDDSVETGFILGDDEIPAQDDDRDRDDDDDDAVSELGVSMQEGVDGEPSVRRALFQKLVKDKEQSGDHDAKPNMPSLRMGRRANVVSCQYGRWCRNFASIVLIGNSK
jgi:hypothetical protein